MRTGNLINSYLLDEEINGFFVRLDVSIGMILSTGFLDNGSDDGVDFFRETATEALVLYPVVADGFMCVFRGDRYESSDPLG